MNDSIKQLLVAFLLIGAGLLSPSNSLDDKVNRDLLRMLTTTSTIIICTFMIFLIYKRFYLDKRNPS